MSAVQRLQIKGGETISQISLGNRCVISCKLKDLAGINQTAAESADGVHHSSEMSAAFS